MYQIKQFPEKKFKDKMDQTRFLKDNLKDLTALKMAEYKQMSTVSVKDELVNKEFEPLIEDISGDFISVKTVINSTNIIDSHLDLHLKDIWNKTVIDNPYSYHLKQHENKFESVISKKAKSYNELMNFKYLGLNADFSTTANINEFVLERSKMPFMFDAYKNGDVLQHSIGMMYVKIDVAWYDEDSEKNMNFFNEMKALAVNPEKADEHGYFWVVYEAKKREGSAVVFGSNSVTPTLWVKNYEPQTGTRNKGAEGITPANDEKKQFINFNMY